MYRTQILLAFQEFSHVEFASPFESGFSATSTSYKEATYPLVFLVFQYYSGALKPSKQFGKWHLGPVFLFNIDKYKHLGCHSRFSPLVLCRQYTSWIDAVLFPIQPLFFTYGPRDISSNIWGLSPIRPSSNYPNMLNTLAGFIGVNS